MNIEGFPNPTPDDDVVKFVSKERYDRVVFALRWLVALKDGPRDSVYRANKQHAWDHARKVLKEQGDE